MPSQVNLRDELDSFKQQKQSRFNMDLKENSNVKSVARNSISLSQQNEVSPLRQKVVNDQQYQTL